MSMTQWQTVKRNVATGGRVVKVGGTHTHRPDARAEADRRNVRENREGRNVCWTVREYDPVRAMRAHLS